MAQSGLLALPGLTSASCPGPLPSSMLARTTASWSWRFPMDAHHPPTSQPVAEIVSLTRLATAIFSVIALMLAFGALIVASDKNERDGTKVQSGVVQSASTVLAASAIPTDATPVSLTEFAINPKMVMVNKGG